MAEKQQSDSTLRWSKHRVRQLIQELPANVTARGTFWLLVAHLPFLLSWFRLLWSLDHYTFFPFALFVSGLLLWERVDRNVFRWTRVCSLLLLADVSLVLIGIAVSSTWPVFVGFVLAITALCLATRDRDTGRNLLHAVLPLAILIRPPFGLDIQLINRLQELTTRLGSTILHHLQYWHFRSGNVLQFRDKTLLVEEACSGIQSLFSVLFLASVIVAWQRRRLIPAAVLMLAAGLSAIVFNVVRVLGIAIAWGSWRLDISSGAMHELWGYACLILAAVALMSMDQLIQFFCETIPLENFRGKKSTFLKAWNWLFDESRASSRSSKKKQKLMPRVLRCGYVVPVVAMVLFSGQLYAAFFRGSNVPVTHSSIELFSESDLPERLGDWKRETYKAEKRGYANRFGQYSNAWQFERGQQTNSISCDHSFRGWHNLESCYQSRGWKVENKEVVEPDAPSNSGTASWPAVAVTLSKPTGEYSFFVYSLFDAGGRPVVPPRASASASLIDRVWRKSPLNAGVQDALTYQTQVFAETAGPVTNEYKAELIQQHQETRSLLLKRFLEHGQKGSQQ